MWNLNYCNSSCNNYEQFRLHQEHLERLLLIKNKLNSKDLYRQTVKQFKPNKTQSEIRTQKNIAYLNTILYNRMCDIKAKPSPYSKSQLKPSYCPAFDKSRTLWFKQRKTTQLKKENTSLKQRFTNSKSFYNIELFELQNDYYRSLEKSMSTKVVNPNLYFKPFSSFKRTISNQYSNSTLTTNSPSPLTNTMSSSMMKSYTIDQFKLTHSSTKNNRKQYAYFTLVSNDKTTGNTQANSIKD